MRLRLRFAIAVSKINLKSMSIGYIKTTYYLLLITYYLLLITYYLLLITYYLLQI